MVNILDLIDEKDFCLRKAHNKDKNTIYSYKLNTIINNDEVDIEEQQKIKDYLVKDVNQYLNDYRIIIIKEEISGVVCVRKMENGYLLDEIYVIEKYRGLGIGSKIIKHIQKKVIEEGKSLYLWVYKRNKGAIKLYKSLNFILIEETEARYKLGFNV